MKSAIVSFFALFFLSIALLRGIPAPTDDTPKDDNLIREGEVAVTSLEELKRYTDAGLFEPRQYDFYYDLISDDGEHEEFHSVVIPEFEITFTPTENHSDVVFESSISFTVTESDLDTLPVGTYRKELTSGVILFFDDIEDTEERSIYKIPEVKKLQTFLYATYIWNTPEYGKGVDYPGIYNYICSRYGDNQSISAEDFCRIAKEEFGLEDGEKYLEENGIMWDGRYVASGMGGITAYRVEEVADDENTVTVVVQYYADRTWLLKSHKVAYKLGKDGKWLGYTILEEGRYQPLDFRYIEDSMGEKITSVPYYIYADEAAGERVILMAQYGESVGKSADGKFYAGTDGTRYDVFGIYNSNTQSFGYFSTHHVRSFNGELTGSVSGMYYTYTTQYALSNGNPTEVTEGKYNNKLFSPGIGLVERTIEFTADGKIYLEEKCETDSSFGGTYKGTYKSDKQTGELVLTLTPVSLNSGAEADNKELKIVGKLLSCGRTCFVPLESELASLSPDFPLPLVLEN